MIIIGFVMGVIAVKLWESRKRRINSKLENAYKEGFNSAKLGKFDTKLEKA